MNTKRGILKLLRGLFYREDLLFVVILLLGAFTRFYRIRDYLVFLGDEGRDVLVVRRMIVDGALTLLGPITSVGGMYLGPAYYYLMAPFLWIFKFDPVGPAIMVGCLSLVTMYFIYRLGRDFLNTPTGIIASLLYALSPIVVIYSRSSWNPNVVPLFSLLIIYGLLQFLQSQKTSWLFVVGAAFGMIIQLHYLALFFAGIIAVTLVVFKPRLRPIQTLLTIAGFIATFSPFILFELRHNFPNTQTIFRFVTRGGGDAVFSLSRFFSAATAIAVRLFWQLVVVENAEITKIAILGLTVFFMGYFLYKKGTLKERKTLTVLLIWLLVAIASYGLYTGAIYEYYFVPVFPLPFLLVGFFLSELSRLGKVGKTMTLTVIGVLLFSYLAHSSHRQTPNRLLTQMQAVADFTLSLAQNQPYNFALISAGNSDHAYRYFFDLSQKAPVTIENMVVDPNRRSVTAQLIVICEDIRCQPLGHALWEVAGFGRAEVAGQWDVFNVRVFRLVHAATS